MAATEDRPVPIDEGRRTRPTSDRSPWNWLLVLPIVIPLLVPVFNRTDPTLFGFPFFYWGQLACIALGVLTTTVVYQMTKGNRRA